MPMYDFYIIILPSSRYYIGSTKNFYSRLLSHQCKALKDTNFLYNTIRAEGGLDKCLSIFLFKIDVDKYDRRMIENFLINFYKNDNNECLNIFKLKYNPFIKFTQCNICQKEYRTCYFKNHKCKGIKNMNILNYNVYG